jgi:predicted component of type VI protein secretion system
MIRPGSRTAVPGIDLVYERAGVLRVVTPGTPAGLTLQVDLAGTVLGRDDSCELILNSAHVSRRHAMVIARDGVYVVEDLGSLNGTTLNGIPVIGVTALSDGDRLGLAGVEVEFRLAA